MRTIYRSKIISFAILIVGNLYAADVDKNGQDDLRSLSLLQVEKLWHQNKIVKHMRRNNQKDDSSLSLQIFATSQKEDAQGKIKTLTYDRVYIDEKKCELIPLSINNNQLPFVFSFTDNPSYAKVFTIKVRIKSNFNPYNFHVSAVYPAPSPASSQAVINAEVLYKGTISFPIKEIVCTFAFPKKVRFPGYQQENLPQWLSVNLWQSVTLMEEPYKVSASLSLAIANGQQDIDLKNEGIKIDYQDLLPIITATDLAVNIDIDTIQRNIDIS